MNRVLLILPLVLALLLTGCTMQFWEPEPEPVPEPSPRPPTAVLEWSYLGEVVAEGIAVERTAYPPGEFAFSAANSGPGAVWDGEQYVESEIESYSWVLDETDEELRARARNFVLGEPGTHEVFLIVRDKNGLTDTAKAVIFIENPTPEPPPDEPDTKTDSVENEYFVYERSFISPVVQSESVEVEVRVTAKADLELVGCNEHFQGETETMFEYNLSAGEEMVRTYPITAPETPGDYEINGACRAAITGTSGAQLLLNSTISIIEGGDE